MAISEHPFTNSDTEYSLIKRFLLELENFPEVDNNWDPGRMDWWRYNVHAEKEMDFFKANARYWKTAAGSVVGLFVSEYGGNDFFVRVHPRAPELLATILNWAVQCWARGKKKITTSVFTRDRHKVGVLTSAGFYQDGHESNIRLYDLKGYDFKYDLKPGFKLLSFREYGDYASRVKLVRNAFQNETYSAQRLRSLHNSPAYHAELDLVVVNSRGESVAYCMGWIDENDLLAGYIEPMGTHTDYRRNGLATVLAKACFKRLSRLGVERVRIASDAEPDISNLCYEALNPVSTKRAYHYALKLS